MANLLSLVVSQHALSLLNKVGQEINAILPVSPIDLSAMCVRMSTVLSSYQN